MADRVLFLGWDKPVVGREVQAAELFQKSLAYYTKLQEGGKIDSFEPVILSRHGGDLNGFIMLRGSAAQVAELKESSEYLDLVIEAGHLIDGFGAADGYINEGLADVMGRWTSVISK